MTRRAWGIVAVCASYALAVAVGVLLAVVVDARLHPPADMREADAEAVEIRTEAEEATRDALEATPAGELVDTLPDPAVDAIDDIVDRAVADILDALDPDETGDCQEARPGGR